MTWILLKSFHYCALYLIPSASSMSGQCRSLIFLQAFLIYFLSTITSTSMNAMEYHIERILSSLKVWPRVMSFLKWPGNTPTFLLKGFLDLRPSTGFFCLKWRVSFWLENTFSIGGGPFFWKEFNSESAGGWECAYFCNLMTSFDFSLCLSFDYFYPFYTCI